MPIPSPDKGDSKKKFLERCMANPTMNKEFKDSSQRYAVCQTKWKEKKKKAKGAVSFADGDEILF